MSPLAGPLASSSASIPAPDRGALGSVVPMTVSISPFFSFSLHITGSPNPSPTAGRPGDRR
jgi:hypothetical protein